MAYTPPFTQRERTRGESLVRRATVWLTLAAMAGTAAVAAAVANAMPGRSTHVTSSAASTPVSGSSAGGAASGSPSGGATSGGGVAPAPATAPPAVTSGGS
ncbi:MAG: hypothetical protein ACYCS9_02895 [Candidatus Dormibacteria bacterium]